MFINERYVAPAIAIRRNSGSPPGRTKQTPADLVQNRDNFFQLATSYQSDNRFSPSHGQPTRHMNYDKLSQKDNHIPFLLNGNHPLDTNQPYINQLSIILNGNKQRFESSIISSSSSSSAVSFQCPAKNHLTKFPFTMPTSSQVFISVTNAQIHDTTNRATFISCDTPPLPSFSSTAIRTTRPSPPPRIPATLLHQPKTLVHSPINPGTISKEYNVSPQIFKVEVFPSETNVSSIKTIKWSRRDNSPSPEKQLQQPSQTVIPNINIKRPSAFVEQGAIDFSHRSRDSERVDTNRSNSTNSQVINNMTPTPMTLQSIGYEDLGVQRISQPSYPLQPSSSQCMNSNSNHQHPPSFDWRANVLFNQSEREEGSRLEEIFRNPEQDEQASTEGCSHFKHSTAHFIDSTSRNSSSMCGNSTLDYSNSTQIETGFIAKQHQLDGACKQLSRIQAVRSAFVDNSKKYQVHQQQQHTVDHYKLERKYEYTQKKNENDSSLPTLSILSETFKRVAHVRRVSSSKSHPTAITQHLLPPEANNYPNSSDSIYERNGHFKRPIIQPYSASSCSRTTIEDSFFHNNSRQTETSF